MGWFLYVCQIFGTYSFWLNGNWTCPLLWQVLKRKQSWCVRFHIKPHYELEAPKQVASRKLKWRIKESWKNICSFVCCSNASPVLAKAFFFKKCFKCYTHLDIQLIDFEIYSVCSNFRFSKLHVLRYKDIYFAFFQEKVCVWCTRCGETYATVLGKKAAIVLNKCMSCIQFHANCIHNTRYIYGVIVTWQ